MSETKRANIPPVVYVINITENFEKQIVWDHWENLIEECVSQFVKFLTTNSGWSLDSVNPNILKKQIRSTELTFAVHLDLANKQIKIHGQTQSRVKDSEEKKERQRQQKLLERSVLEAEVDIQEELYQAFKSTTVEIESGDYFSIQVEWESIMGQQPGLYVKDILQTKGWEAQGESGVYVKSLENNSQVKLDLNKQEAIIQSSRSQFVSVLDKSTKTRELQKQVYDDVENVKDDAMLELNTLKQNIYKEILMDFARSKGDVSVSSQETDSEYHLVIEITPEC